MTFTSLPAAADVDPGPPPQEPTGRCHCTMPGGDDKTVGKVSFLGAAALSAVVAGRLSRRRRDPWKRRR